MTYKFELTQEQISNFEGWKATLPESKSTTIGGRFVFSFTPSSIGTFAEVLDLQTGAKADLSDSEHF
jgi:hypothetical protein